MENVIVRNVKKEDLKAVSEIVVSGWRTAYKGIIDDDYLNSLSVEENYKRRLEDYKENGFIVAELNNEIVGFCRYTLENHTSRAFYEKMGGVLCGENTITRGGKEYKEVGFKYEIDKLN